MTPSCSAKELLDDLSKVSSFSKNKELAKVYSNLASSLIKTSQNASQIAQKHAEQGINYAISNNGLISQAGLDSGPLFGYINDIVNAGALIQPNLAMSMGRLAFYVFYAKDLQARGSNNDAAWDRIASDYANTIAYLSTNLQGADTRIKRLYGRNIPPQEIDSIFGARGAGTSGNSVDTLPLYREFLKLVVAHFSNYDYLPFKEWFLQNSKPGALENSYKDFVRFYQGIFECYKKHCTMSSEIMNKAKSWMQKLRGKGGQEQPQPNQAKQTNTTNTNPTEEAVAPAAQAASAAQAAPSRGAAASCSVCKKYAAEEENIRAVTDVKESVPDIKSKLGTDPEIRADTPEEEEGLRFKFDTDQCRHFMLAGEDKVRFCEKTKKFLYEHFASQGNEITSTLYLAQSLVDSGLQVAREEGERIDIGESEKRPSGTYDIAAKYMAQQYLKEGYRNYFTRLFISIHILSILSKGSAHF